MSIKKHDIAKEYRQGAADCLLMTPCEDWSKKSSHYFAGWSAMGVIKVQMLHDRMNEYLRSIGESEMSLCHLQSSNKKNECVDCHETIKGKPVYVKQLPKFNVLGPMCQGCKLKRAERW